MRNPGGVRKQLAEMDAGDAGGDAPERSGELAAGQGMPALKLADATVEPDKADLLIFFGDFSGNGGLEQAAKSNAAAKEAEDTTSGQGVKGGLAGCGSGMGHSSSALVIQAEFC